ncbi:MAG: DUF2341 domain-containing protein, partial [Candidatus Thorarchaeota archaeon]
MIGRESLDHEIELFDQTGNGTHAHLIAWVRVPFLSSAENTKIVMLYGNDKVGNQEAMESVWDSRYAGVWHLSEDPTGTIFDSTAFGHDGTGMPGGSEPTLTTGKIDGCTEFYGTTLHRIEVPHSDSLSLPTDVTLEAWVRTTNTDGSSDTIVAKWDQVGERNYWLGKLDAATLSFFVDDTQTVSTLYSLINDGNWHHVVGVADAAAGELRIIVDGTVRNTASYTGSTQTGPSVLHIGNNPGSVGLDQEWDGRVDEVRVSKSVRSADWIATSFTNQDDPEAFYSIGWESGVAWWNSDWNYRRETTVMAGASAIPSGYSVNVTFDHASLVSAGKSMANGDDVRIIYWDGSVWNELDRVLDLDTSWNDAFTTVWFKTQAVIPTSTTDDNYYLYYGNPSASSPPADRTSVFLFYDGFESGDLSGWDGSNTASGDTLFVVNTPLIPVYSGTLAARAEVDNVADAQAMFWWNLADTNSLFARIHIYLNPGFSTSDHVTVMQYGTAGWSNQLSVTIDDDMTMYMWNAIAGEAYGFGIGSTISI